MLEFRIPYYPFPLNVGMLFKYASGDKVKFTFKDKELEGMIQGCKEGKEPLYMVWVGDKYGWIRESLLAIQDNYLCFSLK